MVEANKIIEAFMLTESSLIVQYLDTEDKVEIQVVNLNKGAEILDFENGQVKNLKMQLGSDEKVYVLVLNEEEQDHYHE